MNDVESHPVPVYTSAVRPTPRETRLESISRSWFLRSFSTGGTPSNFVSLWRIGPSSPLPILRHKGFSSEEAGPLSNRTEPISSWLSSLPILKPSLSPPSLPCFPFQPSRSFFFVPLLFSRTQAFLCSSVYPTKAGQASKFQKPTLLPTSSEPNRMLSSPSASSKPVRPAQDLNSLLSSEEKSQLDIVLSHFQDQGRAEEQDGGLSEGERFWLVSSPRFPFPPSPSSLLFSLC